MGRVKVPRCDNCGAPVEFATGVMEARCQYCGEVLIRELPEPAPAPPPPPTPHYRPPAPPPRAARTSLLPYVLTGGAMLAMASATGIANFAAQMKPLPAPVPETKVALATVPELRANRESTTVQRSDSRTSSTAAARAAEAGASRGKRLARPTASAAPAISAPPPEPPKPPRFDTQAAIQGLDAAKAKAEASCKSATGARLFVNMGFDPDGVNRGASVSDSTLRGTPEAKCVLRIFRSVRIPPFDLATRPSGLGRPVRL
jgi:hypothetical protein